MLKFRNGSHNNKCSC